MADIPVYLTYCSLDNSKIFGLVCLSFLTANLAPNTFSNNGYIIQLHPCTINSWSKIDWSLQHYPELISKLVTCTNDSRSLKYLHQRYIKEIESTSSWINIYWLIKKRAIQLVSNCLRGPKLKPLKKSIPRG